jgi:hypothetical protein
MMAELKPRGEMETILVERIVSSLWRLKRALLIENRYNMPSEQEEDAKEGERLKQLQACMKYETALENQVYKAWKKLAELQKERPARDLSSISDGDLFAMLDYLKSMPEYQDRKKQKEAEEEVKPIENIVRYKEEAISFPPPQDRLKPSPADISESESQTFIEPPFKFAAAKPPGAGSTPGITGGLPGRVARPQIREDNSIFTRPGPVPVPY